TPPLSDPRTFLLGVPLLVTLAAVGIAGVVAGRARPWRTAVLLSAAGVAATALAGLSLLVSFRYAGGAVVWAVGGGYAVALALTAVAVRRVGPVVEVEAGLPASGVLVALVPVAAAILAAIIRMAIYGSTDNISILIATVIGSLIAVRQMLANSAARRY